MITSTIRLRDCLDIIDSGQKFSFSAFTCNEQKRTAGELLEYSEARLFKRGSRHTAEIQEEKPKPKKAVKNPNHNFHATRNFQILAAGQPTNTIVKVHIDLMVIFNGQKVILP